MEVFTIERIITVAVLCVWFIFPVGMFISFIYQDKHQKYPKISQVHPPKHQPEYHRQFVLNDFDIDDDDEDDDDIVIPTIPAHQIPKTPNPIHTNWKT